MEGTFGNRRVSEMAANLPPDPPVGVPNAGLDLQRDGSSLARSKNVDWSNPRGLWNYASTDLILTFPRCVRKVTKDRFSNTMPELFAHLSAERLSSSDWRGV